MLWHADQLKNSSTALQQLVAGYPALLNTPWVWGDSSGVMLQPNGTFGTGDTADQRMRAASSRSGLMCQPVTHIANLPDAAAANNVAPLSKQRSATAAAAAAATVATATQQEQPPQLLKMPPLLSAPTQQP